MCVLFSLAAYHQNMFSTQSLPCNVRPGLCVTHGVLVYSRDFRFRSSKDGIGGIIAYFHVWHVLAVDTQCYDMTD